MRPILLDTGPIVALLDPTDRMHEKCARAIAEIRGPLITCEAVITECCHLLRSIPSAVASILESVHEREFGVPASFADSARAVSRIMAKYHDSEIDFADAFLIHLANEFETGQILTVDRDFRFFRWAHNKPFEILIDLD